MKYYDFTLILEILDDERWIVRIESENQGETGKVQLEIPSAQTIAELNRRFENRETDRAYLKSVGLDLFRRLMVDKARDMFLLSLGEVRNDTTRGLRLRFRVLDPEIAALPWELLYSDLDDAFVSTRVKTPIVRYIDMPLPRAKLAVPYPIKLLAVTPRGDDTTGVIDIDAERKVIDQATTRFADKVEVTYLADRYEDRRVTWLRLVECLAEEEFHCVHYIGHGAFQDDRGFVLLDGDSGSGEFVEEETFAEGLANARELKLVLLNACNTATLSSSKPLAGVAAKLVRAGVPAVVAMQFSILDAAAIVFARVFYHSLLIGDNRGRVDVAVSRGRHALGAKFADQRELAAPVLFTHAKTNVLLVPEGEGILANVPLTGNRLDTLEDARDTTESPDEQARFAKRVRIGRGAIQAAIIIGLLAFLMSAVRLLDIFTIDTRAEFAVMALGNGIVDHRVSEDLQIVTIDGEGLTTAALRERVGQAVGIVNSLGAKTIALDIFYPTENGEFKTDPASGQALVDKIAASSAPVVIGATEVADAKLRTPDAMRGAVSDIGLACFESKLGLARSLPISARIGESAYPSFALVAVGTYLGASVSPGFQEDSTEPYLAFPDRPSHQFVVSEFNRAGSAALPCSALTEGSEVAHRFVRRTPGSLLQNVTMPFAELQSAGSPGAFAGKLVVIGVTGKGDIVQDLAGARDGVFWQADAINNLLLDEVIKPVNDFSQLLLMLLVVTLAMVLALKLRNRKSALWPSMIGLWATLLVATVILYGRFGLLLNPVYSILAAITAWWIARRFGQRWIIK